MNQADTFQSASNWKYLLICPSQGITKDLHQTLGANMPNAEILEIPVYPPSAQLPQAYLRRLPMSASPIS